MELRCSEYGQKFLWIDFPQYVDSPYQQKYLCRDFHHLKLGWGYQLGLKGDFVKVRFLGLGIGEGLGLELAIQMAEIFHIVFIIGLVNNRGLHVG